MTFEVLLMVYILNNCAYKLLMTMLSVDKVLFEREDNGSYV